MAILKVRILVTFQDLNIIPRKLKQGEELEVTDNQYERLKNSGAKMELLNHVITKDGMDE